MATPPTAAAVGVAGTREARRGRESQGAVTPSQGTQHPQIEVGGGGQKQCLLWTLLINQDVLDSEVLLYTYNVLCSYMYM